MDGAAANFPDINFVIFHVGLPWLDEVLWQIVRFPNLYASIAATVNFISRHPRVFAETLGKMLWWCGEDKIIYGGESPIWHPQWALEAFWNFELPTDIVEDYGYPPLTEQAKRKILGGQPRAPARDRPRGQGGGARRAALRQAGRGPRAGRISRPGPRGRSPGMTSTLTTPLLYAVVPSPVGPLLLSGDEDALTGLRFADAPSPGSRSHWRRDDARFRDEAGQLAEYFAGERTGFDIPMRLEGAAFDRRVWDALRAIPHGTTTTYGALAALIGQPGQARAVGSANARNPVSIVVPCHRVIGAGGKLVGYGGGLERKRALLAHEGAILV